MTMQISFFAFLNFIQKDNAVAVIWNQNCCSVIIRKNVSCDQSSTPTLLNMSAILVFGGHLENGRIRSGQESFCNLHYLENICCKFHACIIN